MDCICADVVPVLPFSLTRVPRNGQQLAILAFKANCSQYLWFIHVMLNVRLYFEWQHNPRRKQENKGWEIEDRPRR